MPEDWKEQIGGHDAIFFGAVGWPAKIPDHVSLWGSLHPVPPRVRPVRQPAAGAPDARRAVAAGRTASPATSTSTSCARTPRASTPRSAAACSPAPSARSSMQETVMSPHRRRPRAEVRLRAGAESRPKKHLTSATKSNGISITMPYWDERVEAMAKSYPDVQLGQVPHRHPHRAFRAATRTASTSSSPRTCSATSSPTSARPAPAPSASRRRGNINPGAHVSLAVRAGARLGARHRRPGHRQPDRPDLVGRDDARASRREARRAAAIVAAIEKVLAEPKPRTARPRRHRRHRRPAARRWRKRWPDWVQVSQRHGRACPGHPRLTWQGRKAWMPGT